MADKRADQLRKGDRFTNDAGDDVKVRKTRKHDEGSVRIDNSDGSWTTSRNDVVHGRGGR